MISSNNAVNASRTAGPVVLLLILLDIALSCFLSIGD
jgi:hypothetical protein